MQELIERVLGVCCRLAEEDGAGGVFDVVPRPSNRFAVRLHGQLLQVGGESVHVLVEGRDEVGLRAEEVGVPHAEEATDDGDILLQGGFFEVFVHGVCAGEELVEVVEADVEGDAEADGAPDAVAAADPGFEAEHVLLVDAELGHFLHVCGEGDKMFCDCALIFGRF